MMNLCESPSVIRGIAGLRERVGQELGASPWRAVTQREVDEFARLTGDLQWIHVDVPRAEASPFGGTIVHGYFVLSLAPVLAAQVYEVRGFPHALNYGLGKVRFPAPLAVGAAVRLRVALRSLIDVSGGVRAEFEQVFEREGGDKPVAVVTKLTQFMLEAQ
jgi:acyl dehydratase